MPAPLTPHLKGGNRVVAALQAKSARPELEWLGLGGQYSQAVEPSGPSPLIEAFDDQDHG